MTTLPIITLPHLALRQVSEPVAQVDSDVVRLVDDMFETMYDAPGVGLAAIQVNVPKRIVVVDTAGQDEPPNPLCLINPEIVALGDQTRVYEEGCLSIPDVQIEIERPSTCTVRYIDKSGKAQELNAGGLLATAIQHEIDHLDGKLIIDYASRLRREMIVRKFKKLARSS